MSCERFSSFSFIITLLTAMKCLSVLKHQSVKLQKRDLDVYKAHTDSNNATEISRTSETISKAPGPSGSIWRSLPRKM